MAPPVASEMEEEELVLESSMNVAAAEVVEAMAVAPTGSGWLWVPSYVVTRIDMSSRHRCTCIYMRAPSQFNPCTRTP